MADRPIALVTGASRRVGIGAAIARRLASDGWDLATTHCSHHDVRMPWGSDPTEVVELQQDLHDAGARTVSLEADLSDTDAPGEVFGTS